MARLPGAGMMVKLPHADLRTHHLSAKSGAAGHKPDDLAPSIGQRRQHNRRSALHRPDCHGMV